MDSTIKELRTRLVFRHHGRYGYQWYIILIYLIFMHQQTAQRTRQALSTAVKLGVLQDITCTYIILSSIKAGSKDMNLVECKVVSRNIQQDIQKSSGQDRRLFECVIDEVFNSRISIFPVSGTWYVRFLIINLFIEKDLEYRIETLCKLNISQISVIFQAIIHGLFSCCLPKVISYCQGGFKSGSLLVLVTFKRSKRSMAYLNIGFGN